MNSRRRRLAKRRRREKHLERQYHEMKYGPNGHRVSKRLALRSRLRDIKQDRFFG